MMVETVEKACQTRSAEIPSSYTESTSESVVATLTFTGRRYDPESDLMYFRNRYYSPELGRFVTRDPIGYRGGINLYVGYFVPRGVDPHGKECGECLPPTNGPNRYSETVTNVVFYSTPSPGYAGYGYSIIDIMDALQGLVGGGGLTGGLDPGNIENIIDAIDDLMNDDPSLAEEQLGDIHDMIMNNLGFQVQIEISWTQCEPCTLAWYYRLFTSCEAGEWVDQTPFTYTCQGWYQWPGGPLPYEEFDQDNYSECVEQAIQAIPLTDGD